MNEAQSLYNELFFDTSLEVGKTLSKAERDTKCLTNEKVCAGFAETARCVFLSDAPPNLLVVPIYLIMVFSSHYFQSLIYGEVEFNSFYRVLRKINPAPGKVFYDLGSGTGKVSKCLNIVLTFVTVRVLCCIT